MTARWAALLIGTCIAILCSVVVYYEGVSWWVSLLVGVVWLGSLWGYSRMGIPENPKRILHTDEPFLCPRTNEPCAVVTGHREEIQRIVADLENRNADLERFASMTAHQLRSPPRTIAGIALALQEDYGHLLDAHGLQFLADIQEDAVTMAEIVDGLYQVSKVRTLTELPLEPVDLNQVMADLKISKTKRGLLRVQDKFLWSHLPVVRGDPILLHEVFRNLIENSLKFNESPVKIIRVSAVPRGDGRWDISVTDNGIGIDPKYQNKVFQMFQRMHPSYKGTGIGLALVAAIVQKLGGAISLKSAVNAGSTFTLDLEAS